MLGLLIEAGEATVVLGEVFVPRRDGVLLDKAGGVGAVALEPPDGSRPGAGWRGVREEPAFLRPSRCNRPRTWQIWVGRDAHPRRIVGVGNSWAVLGSVVGRPR